MLLIFTFILCFDTYDCAFEVTYYACSGCRMCLQNAFFRGQTKNPFSTHAIIVT